MRKRLLFGIIAACLLLFLLLGYPLLSRNNILPKITIDLHPERQTENRTDESPQLEIEDQSSCPSQLRLNYYVRANYTASLNDDVVFISILNPDETDYEASIFVNGDKETDTSLPARSWINISSSIITAWWRQPPIPGEGSAPLPEGYVPRQISTFLIDVKIVGCDETIRLITPDNPSGQNSGSPGGGGGGGGSSGSPIRITQSTGQFVND